MSTISKVPSRPGELFIPLADTDEVRLLCLVPRSLSEAVRCTLKHVKLSDKPRYEALSYEWGKKEVEPFFFFFFFFFEWEGAQSPREPIQCVNQPPTQKRVASPLDRRSLYPPG
jgi:hypothetical protein